MKNHKLQGILSLLAALMLTMTLLSGSAEEISVSEKLQPLLDLVSAASMYSTNSPETVPGDNGILSSEFVRSFLITGQSQGAELGITKDMLTDTAAQQTLLSSIFAAKLPELTAIQDTVEAQDFIGFLPVVEEKIDNGVIRIIGEVYMSSSALRNLTTAEFADVDWIDRALFLLRPDDTAFSGYRLIGFALGTDLSYEEEFRAYSDRIAVEYESNLGFMLLYPACISDEMLVESEGGVAGQTEDGKLSFFARREANSSKATLAPFIENLSSSINGSTYSINEEMQYATLRYFTDDGRYVFDVFTVTDDYIYQAELSCANDSLMQYCMYCSYLENSFVIDEVSQG